MAESADVAKSFAQIIDRRSCLRTVRMRSRARSTASALSADSLQPERKGVELDEEKDSLVVEAVVLVVVLLLLTSLCSSCCCCWCCCCWTVPVDRIALILSAALRISSSSSVKLPANVDSCAIARCCIKRSPLRSWSKESAGKNGKRGVRIEPVSTSEAMAASY